MSWKRPTVVFGAFVAAGAAFWIDTIYKSSQSQKSHNTLFRGLIYHLNESPHITRILGSPVVHCGDRVDGSVNIIKGVADLAFNVRGDKQAAVVKFVGMRQPRRDSWQSNEFTLQLPDGTSYNLSDGEPAVNN